MTGLLKFIVIFACGFLETWLYAWYILLITKRHALRSALVVTVQMAVYLSILAYVIKSMDTFLLIGLYCVGCGCGNFFKVKYDGVKIIIRKKRKKPNEKIYQKKLH